MRRSAAALFLCAGLITIANQLLAAPAGTRTPVVIGCGLVSLLSAGVVLVAFRRTHAWWVKVAVALWGLVLLVSTAAFGNTVTSPKEPMAVVIFMMVILVWLGLTVGRGLATAFAPLALAAAAVLASLPDSRVVFNDAALVIAVSTAVAETIAWAMHELSRREHQLAEQAATDPLTGLANRAAFTDRLDAACRAQERVVLVFVDLNGFKDVNDTYGHQAGDAVLVEVGARLTRIARDRDVVARFGGDEFVLLFRDVPTKVRTEALVERIRIALDEPWPELGATPITASVGIVDNRDGDAGPEELIRTADTAMYSRKHGTESAASPRLMISRALAHHRAAMDGLGGGFCVMRRIASRDDWIIVEANRRIRDAFEPVFGDPVGRLLSDLNRHADNSGALDLYAKVLETGERAEIEMEIRIPGEPAGWRRLVAVPIAPETVAALTWDITTERLARRALADAVEHSTAVVESAADAILTVGADGRIVGFNRAAEAAFGERPRGRHRPSVRRLRAGGVGSGPARRVRQRRRDPGRDQPAPGRRLGVHRAGRDVRGRDESGHRVHRHRARRDRAARGGIGAAGGARVRRPHRPSQPALAPAAHRRRGTSRRGRRPLDRRAVRRPRPLHARERQPRARSRRLPARRRRGPCGRGRTRGRRGRPHQRRPLPRALRAGRRRRRARGARVADPRRAPPAVRARGRPRGVRHRVDRRGPVARPRGTRDLVRFAHTAMQQAKRTGPSSVRVFSGEMAVVSASRLEAETALRRALDRDELQAYYQPIVDLDTGTTVRLEALVRWSRPGCGLVQPNEFIDLAEQTGLIIPLGAWMLRRALTDCAGWQADAPGVGVAVNVSAHQFRTGDLVAMVQSLLTELELAPGLVTLEITESLMLEHTAWNLAILEELRELGVRLALDDFGTGYSALTHLRRLPIDTIKMDRSFLDGIAARDGEATVRAIVELARVHGMEVVAEGIETEETRDLVRSAGCHRGQGYLFGRPERLDAALLSLRAATPPRPVGSTPR